MIESILIFTVSVAFTVMCADIDYEHLIDGDYIESHASRALHRALFPLAISIYDYKAGIASGLIIGALFDQFLNGLLGKDFFFLGDTAKWDIFFKKRKYLYIGIKVGMLSTAFYLLTHN